MKDERGDETGQLYKITKKIIVTTKKY